jgi:hypothetical protein
MRILILIASLLFLIFSCELPFSKVEPNTIDLINISGSITNTTDGPPIRLFQSFVNSSGNFSSITPILKAKVEIIENDDLKVLFEERNTDPGFYFPPIDFLAKEKTQYKLKITLPNGNIYWSSNETMPIKKAKILDFRQNFEFSNTPYYDLNYFARHAVYVDFKDEP